MLIGTNVFVQVIELVTAAAVTLGKPALGDTCTVELAVQPLVGLVATKVKTPADVALVVNVVVEPLTPPNQLAVVPAGLIKLPDKVTVGVVQVIV